VSSNDDRSDRRRGAGQLEAVEGAEGRDADPRRGCVAALLRG
jgi:hypothetical protein